MSENEVLSELKKEVCETLYFFVKTDIELWGYVREDTKTAFANHNVPLPSYLNAYVKK